MPVTYNLLSSQVPTPLAPPTATLGTPTTPFTTAQTYPPPGTSTVFNQVAQALALTCQFGGGGYGILTGLDLYDQNGVLGIGVTAGIALGEGVLELVAASPIGSEPFRQVIIPGAYTLPDNANSYVWLTRTGTLISDTTTTPPAQAVWYLGRVTTAGGAITGIDYSGRITLGGNRFERRTADIGAPVDAPPATIGVQTYTTTGRYVWNGAAHVFQPQQPLVQTLAADLTLNALSPTEIFVKTNGAADRSVILPALATIPPGRVFSVVSTDAVKNILVKKSDGTLLATLTPANYSIVIPTFPDTSGSTALPSSFTPGPVVAVAGTAGGTL